MYLPACDASAASMSPPTGGTRWVDRQFADLRSRALGFSQRRAMTSTLVALTVAATLLAGVGSPGDVAIAFPKPISSSGPLPSVDVPAPQAVNKTAGLVGGQASAIEFDDDDLDASMSAWYRLAYVSGGNRLRVYEHYPPTTSVDPDTAMIRSERIAWWTANEVVGDSHQPFASDRLPAWARVHTGGDTGPSAGLIFALAYLDALTPGALVGNLRVAGTGMLGLDGVVGPVKEIDIKVAAAMLTRPDVIFVPKVPNSPAPVTLLEFHDTRYPAPGYTTSDWLNITGFETAGQVAAAHPRTVTIVVVYDLRQALAWLCGRTNAKTVCDLARRAADLPIGRF